MTSRSDTCPPGFQEVLAALEALKASEPEATDLRKVERIEVTIPAEIRTSDENCPLVCHQTHSIDKGMDNAV